MHTIDTSCSDTVQAWFSTWPDSLPGMTGEPWVLDEVRCPVCDSDDYLVEISRVGGEIIVTAISSS